MDELIYDKKNGNVAFREVDHCYFDLRDPNKKYVSVTTCISEYKEKFDSYFWSRYKALEALIGLDNFVSSGIKSKLLDTKVWKDSYVKLFPVTLQEVEEKAAELEEGYKKNSEEACAYGTAYHLAQELQFYRGGVLDLNKFDKRFTKDYVCIKDHYELDLENGIYPEYLISWEEDNLRISGQIDLLIKEGNDIYLIDYKGLALDTPVATPIGWSTMEELKKGDTVFDEDGKITTILNVSEVHYNPCYKIKFDNGDELVADHEHKWKISFRRGVGTYKDKVMTTEEIAAHLSLNKKETYYIPKIKNPKPIDTINIELPIDPYILGSWLGDGSKSCGIITNINQDFWKEVSKRGYKTSHDLNQNQDRSEMRTVYDISPELRKLNLLNNKHIPDIYLRASYNQRLDLLRGFMDTDGHYNKTRNRFVMNTTQHWQAEDIAKLVSSLGVKPTIIKTYATYDGKTFDCWNTCFFMKENPFLIRNQDINITMKKDSYSYRSIVSVEMTATVATKCIEVDSPNHTFLAGYNMIPTHNTNAKGIEEKSFYNFKTKSHKMMKYPVQTIMDCSKMHYTLQLSFYAKLLQKINPEFQIKLLLLKHCNREGEVTDIEVEYLPNEIEKIIKDVKKKNYIEEQRSKKY